MRASMYVAVAAVCLSASMVVAQPMNAMDAAIFAGGDIEFGSYSTVSGGAVVANGNITHLSGVLDFDSMYAGGTFSGSGGLQDSTGDILVNGDITTIGGPGSVFGGDVTSGGSILFRPSSSHVLGNVTAAVNFEQTFPFAQIDGNLLAGGNVNMAGDVVGNLTYGGTLTTGPSTTVGGATVHGGAVVPTAYVPLATPAGRNLTPSANNINVPTFGDISLAPGSYGTLTLGSSTSVTLTAGQYVFADIVSSFSLNDLRFDTTGGAIDIFVAGDLNLDMTQVINGKDLWGSKGADPALSQLISLEVGGSLTLRSNFFGSIFAPNGDITLTTFTDVTGHVMAGGNVYLGNSTVTMVPEPMTGLMGLGLGLGAMMTRRRRIMA